MTEPVPERMARWNSYLLEPGGRVLRNKLGLTDKDALKAAEYRMRAIRQLEIERGDVQIPRTFDPAHLQALHEHLLQDVYDWAGSWRYVDMYKTEKGYYAPYETLDLWVDHVGKLIRSQDWSAMSRADFVRSIAEVYSNLNVAHPFREGNGMTGKLLISQVAELSSYRLDFDRVEKAEWDRASEESMPPGLRVVDSDPVKSRPWMPADPRVHVPDSQKLYAVFDQITVDREPVDRAADPVVDKSVQLHDSTYPVPGSGTVQRDESMGERPPAHGTTPVTERGTVRKG